MSRIKWDQPNEHFYETGVSKGVLFVMGSNGSYGKAIPWNGLSKVSEKPTGGDATSIYADNTKYLNIRALEEFEASIEAYTYPEEFAACDGSAQFAKGAIVGQQPRKTFAFCYRTEQGNDGATAGSAGAGYKLHIIYGCTASPSQKDYSTINDSPEAISFSWDLKTVPVEVGSGFNNTSCIIIDSLKADAEDLAALEDYIYGTDAGSGSTGTDGALPLPAKVLEILGAVTS